MEFLNQLPADPDFWKLLAGPGAMGVLCLVMMLLIGKKLDHLTESNNDLTIMVAMSLIKPLDHDLARGIAERTIEKIKAKKAKA